MGLEALRWVDEGYHLDDRGRLITIGRNRLILWLFDEIDVNDMLITLTAKMKYRFSLPDLPRPFYNQRLFPRILFPPNEKVIDFSL